MSTDTIAILISIAGLLLALATGFGWMIRRMDDGFERFRSELRGEIHGVRDELRGEIQSVRDELRGEIHRVRDELRGEIVGVRDELVEVKVAVARIEGPGRHLIAR